MNILRGLTSRRNPDKLLSQDKSLSTARNARRARAIFSAFLVSLFLLPLVSLAQTNVVEQAGTTGADELIDRATNFQNFLLHHVLGLKDIPLLHHDAASAIVCLLILLAIGTYAIHRQRRRHLSVRPQGLYNLLETLAVFVRDQIAIPALGPEDGLRMTPLLCTYLSAIFIMNGIGQIPLFASPTGNVNICAALALTTLTLILAAAARRGPMGLVKLVLVESPSKILRLLMAPLELITFFSRIFSLTIRLFANMLSGHIIIFTLLSFSYIYKQLYILPFSVFFAACFALFDLAIAALQAYIFTLLTATYIGLALNPEHE